MKTMKIEFDHKVTMTIDHYENVGHLDIMINGKPLCNIDYDDKILHVYDFAIKESGYKLINWESYSKVRHRVY